MPDEQAGNDARATAMEQAYARGDHQTARTAARALTTSGDAQAQARARAVLAQTEPDRFIEAVALVGLGVVAWLVYNYVL